MSKTDNLVHRLEAVGFSGGFVRTCLPDWWDEQAEQSQSAWVQMQLGLAQRLSLDPISLLDEHSPLRLSDVGRPKYKHLALSADQLAAANGFANGLARLLIAAMPKSAYELPESALELRNLMLSGQGEQWIGFPQLLQLCYAFGIPIAHLTVFPAGIKGMAAMATGIGDRSAIFSARKPIHPAQTAFYIAHELGHIALGHTKNNQTIIEALTLDPDEADDSLPLDEEERSADAFAFELLTGRAEFIVTGPKDQGNASELRSIAQQTGERMGIDPGLLILCYGRSTERWQLASAALKLLPDHGQDSASLVNRALRSQLDSEMLSSEDVAYLDAIAAP